MKGIIVNYRRSRHSAYTNHLIVEVEGVKTKTEASKLIGKKVVWISKGGRKIRGKIAASHGGKGEVRIITEKGLPGQAVGNSINIEQ
ncbi:MAG: 50S ribosomal protein L35ae [Candidatus Marsarchaeota archaeon]|nr:50S ribosomal protein L35ae [Candidatus Marsarchaeota archaeon]